MHAPGESAPAMRVQHSRQEYVLKGEDTSCALDMELDDGAIVKFYGVFDGHGGPRAAQYCAANLATFVRDEFAACKGTRAERLKAACSAAFVACDKKFAATNPGFGDGTTASIVIIDGLELTAANVGDSTVMLYTTDGAEPVPLITDHRVKRRTEAEQKRVLAGGATIGRIKGPNGQPIGPERLYPGGLQVSRSIGDSDSTAACIAEPAVMSCTLPPIGGTIVLASDGVWDFMAEKEIRTLAKTSRTRKTGIGWLSRAIMRTVNQHNVQIDDATVLCVEIMAVSADGSEECQDKKPSLMQRANSFFRRKKGDSAKPASVAPSKPRAYDTDQASNASLDATHDARRERSSSFFSSTASKPVIAAR